MPFASALSEHPLATQAVGEVVGEVLERLGVGPDLAVLFASVSHTGAIEDMADAVRTLLQPRTLIGCTASTVVGTSREVEERPAVSLWAGRLSMTKPIRLQLRRSPDGSGIVGFPTPDELPPGAKAVLLLVDPFSFPAEPFLAGLVEQSGIHIPVIGGLASAARGPGGNRLLLDGEIHTDGAVGALVGGPEVVTVVSQGCRPIGNPMIVTKGEGQIIAELAGRPALERVQRMVQSLSPEDLALARQGLHLGRVIDERKVDYERGDFLIRSVMGADPEMGAVAVGDDVMVGATVQFQVRDAVTAAEDLRHLLSPHRADAALLFTCNGRGTHLFAVPDHDANVVSETFENLPLAGMSCAGEIGPVGGRNFLHGFTASVALFKDVPEATG